MIIFFNNSRIFYAERWLVQLNFDAYNIGLLSHVVRAPSHHFNFYEKVLDYYYLRVYLGVNVIKADGPKLMKRVLLKTESFGSI